MSEYGYNSTSETSVIFFIKYCKIILFSVLMIKLFFVPSNLTLFMILDQRLQTQISQEIIGLVSNTISMSANFGYFTFGLI